MTLLERRIRVAFVRYFSPQVLERDLHFRRLLEVLTHRGLHVAGLLTVAGVVLYLIFRVLIRGADVLWIEPAGAGFGTVQLWDKLLVAGLGFGLVGLGRLKVRLNWGRTAMAVFLLIVGWFVVLRNFDPGNFNMTAGWLTVLMVIGVGTVPFQPWQTLAIGLGLFAQVAYFAEITPGVGGDVPRLVFIMFAVLIYVVISAVLYTSRYAQFRALSRAARLKNYLAARSRDLKRALDRERDMQDQLAQQEKLASLGQLTAGVAHELKNPLNFVTNFSELAKELAAELREVLMANPEQPVREALAEADGVLEDLLANTERIHEHGHRADAIVKNMLAHSRATPGEKRSVDINKLLGEYVGLAYHGMRARHGGFNVEIQRDFDETLSPLLVVPEELGRVFLNLLDNAFDAVRARVEDKGDVAFSPLVRASTEKTAGSVVIRLADNGMGMPEDVVEHVFEPFFTTKPAGEGTGLGLSLAHEIVAQGHEGTLTVESAEGKGTTFTITLPAATAPDATA